MSIREWARKILSNNDLKQKLSQLKQAHSELSSLSLGEKIDLPWSLPSLSPKVQKVTPEIKFLNSVAHIELMAIYLYWDTLAMTEAPKEFYLDLGKIAIQECEHFQMLCERLDELGCPFPAFQCAEYMIQFKEKTQDDVLARLLYVSLYSEGRAVDSKERIVKKLKGYNKDFISAKILERIIHDEVAHLENGVKWFEYFAGLKGMDAQVAHDLAMRKLGLVYRPPFNKELRDKARVPQQWYLKL
jgi:uncharacterized ferritin-like protein (DUF455 family)